MLIIIQTLLSFGVEPPQAPALILWVSDPILPGETMIVQGQHLGATSVCRFSSNFSSTTVDAP